MKITQTKAVNQCNTQEKVIQNILKINDPETYMGIIETGNWITTWVYVAIVSSAGKGLLHDGA